MNIDLKDNDILTCGNPECRRPFHTYQYRSRHYKKLVWKMHCCGQCANIHTNMEIKDKKPSIAIQTNPMFLNTPRFLAYAVLVLFLLSLVTAFSCASLSSPTQINQKMIASAKVNWDENTENDLSGYKVYYGLSSRNYNNEVDVGNTTSFMVSQLEVGKTYFFAATAYDFSGNESEFSEEVSLFTISRSPLLRPELFLLLSSADSLTEGDTLDVQFSQINEKLDGELVEHNEIFFGFSYRPIGSGSSGWVDIARTDTSDVFSIELPLGNLELTVWNFYFINGNRITSDGATPKSIFVKEPVGMIARERREYRAKLILRLKK